MGQENIMFFENDDKSYTIVDLYPNDRFLGYKDSNNYYDIDVDKTLLFKESDLNAFKGNFNLDVFCIFCVKLIYLHKTFYLNYDFK